MALADSAPKLMAEMLNTLAWYGWVQGDTDCEGASGLPPIHKRKSCDGSCVGASEWFTHS